MDSERQRKVALVTGASRGIGRAIAVELAAADVTVVINYFQRREEAEAVVDELAPPSAEAEPAAAAAVAAPQGGAAEHDRPKQSGPIESIGSTGKAQTTFPPCPRSDTQRRTQVKQTRELKGRQPGKQDLARGSGRPEERGGKQREGYGTRIRHLAPPDLHRT